MKKFDNLSIQRYLKLLANHSPVPGGGSAAALAGAMGVALILKSIAFTTHNKSKIFSYHQKKLKKIFSKLTAAITRDSKAYIKVARAMKLPRRNQEEIATRKKKLICALVLSSEISREVVRHSRDALLLLDKINETLNKNFLSDIECARHLLKSAALSSEIFFNENIKFARRLKQK